jgi:hypothetical protein
MTDTVQLMRAAEAGDPVWNVPRLLNETDACPFLFQRPRSKKRNVNCTFVAPRE